MADLMKMMMLALFLVATMCVGNAEATGLPRRHLTFGGIVVPPRNETVPVTPPVLEMPSVQPSVPPSMPPPTPPPVPPPMPPPPEVFPPCTGMAGSYKVNYDRQDETSAPYYIQTSSSKFGRERERENYSLLMYTCNVVFIRTHREKEKKV